MTLPPGARLGPYEIQAPLGAGGMGEVYRARDTKLDRDVAIKVLPELFVADPDRVARFTREAKTLAALNHPNIAAIHGLEESNGLSALVLELVEGPTLADRIARGPIPLDEALPIARQIADALEAAHEQGNIHRDLKPANIKVREDGTVKVLDFGLAKALAGDPLTSPAALTNSPTLTSPVGVTSVGVLLGTAAYMSPEQAKGRAVDKRSDIWAFGVVLYEMLMGRPLFEADSVPETLGLIFSREPDLALFPATTPERVRRLIARCLVKDVRRRLRDMGDARLDLEDTPEAAVITWPTPMRRAWRALPWGIAAALALVAGWALWSRASSSTTDHQLTHLDIGYPRDVEPYLGGGQAPAISPDGRTVAMIGVRGGQRRVFIRRLDRAAVTELPNTVGAQAAVFSPDGGSVAVLFTSTLITRIGLADQERKDVTSGAEIALSITWSQAGIIFSRGGLWVVSPDGGAPRSLTVLERTRREVAHQNAVVLPGGRLVLFTSQTTEASGERIESVAIDGGRRSVVVERARVPVWSPTGHLLFVRDGAVLALALDPSTGAPLGTATPIIRAGEIEPILTGQMALSLSSTGTLLIAPAGFTDTRVVSVGREGAALPFHSVSGRYLNPRISPNGRRLLVENGDSIEALDLGRDTWSPLASTSVSAFCTWSADGTRVMFRLFSSPVWVPADGSAALSFVPRGGVDDYPTSPGPNPDSFLISRIRGETQSDIFLMSISGAFEPKPLISTPAFEGGAQLSPDGRWLLYQSDTLGPHAIYVRRYPALDRLWPVSNGGGTQPRWSRNNREIYYRSGGRMIAVAFDASGAEPVFGKPEALFADDYDFGSGVSIPNYDVTADGRFIMIRRGTNGGRLRVVVNWTEELKRILASGGVQ